MKRINLIILLIALIFAFIPFSKVKAYGDLDLIEKYEITVDPDFSDGSLNIRIDIIWKVLDSSSEGPLEDVYIGVPNYHVSNLNALTDNIKKLKYSENDGSFIRVFFKKQYNAGDVVYFSFSFNLSYMYTLDDDGSLYYDYNPGYFLSIKVNDCILRWNKNNIVDVLNSSVASVIEGDYYKYESALDYGEYIRLDIKYNQASFETLDPKKQFTDRYMRPTTIALIVGAMCLFVGIFVFATIMERKRRDPYMTNRGFVIYHYWGRPGRYYNNNLVSTKGENIVPRSVSGGGCASSGGCACACACACAGGGRAGCSMKDFYHTNLKSNNVIKKLEK